MWHFASNPLISYPIRAMESALRFIALQIRSSHNNVDRGPVSILDASRTPGGS